MFPQKYEHTVLLTMQEQIRKRQKPHRSSIDFVRYLSNKFLLVNANNTHTQRWSRLDIQLILQVDARRIFTALLSFASGGSSAALRYAAILNSSSHNRQQFQYNY